MKLIANNYSEKDVFKFLREWSGLNQKQFAEQLGVSRMTIQSYERGVRRYTFETLMKVADIYGYNIIIQKNKNNALHLRIILLLKQNHLSLLIPLIKAGTICFFLETCPSIYIPCLIFCIAYPASIISLPLEVNIK